MRRMRISMRRMRISMRRMRISMRRMRISMRRMNNLMCEPSHSIIQFDVQDESGQLNAPKIRGGWIRRILSWVHVSKFGRGHSEALSQHPRIWQVGNTLYEGHWWNRDLKIDSKYSCANPDKTLA